MDVKAESELTLDRKVIVIVSAGCPAWDWIYKKAKAWGVRLFMIGDSSSWGRRLVDDGIVERFIVCDASGDDEVPSILVALAEIREEGVLIDGICTFEEFAVTLTAKLASALKLPGNPVAAVVAARSKRLTRAMMEAAGLPTPRHRLLPPTATIEEVQAAGTYVGFPAVVKPTAGAGSLGCMIVESPDKLAATFARCLADTSRDCVAGMGLFYQLAPGDAAPAGSWTLNSELMLEEYLNGDEIDCDIIMHNGRAVYSCISDNWPKKKPWCNETGDNCPSLLSARKQEEIKSLCVKTVAALGLTTGAFNVEAVSTSSGAHIIEVNSRMGQVTLPENNLAVWGVDLVKEHLLTCVDRCGSYTLRDVSPVPLGARSSLYLNASVSGIMGPGDWLAEVRSWPNIVYATRLKNEGDHVICQADGRPTWIGEIMAKGDTVEETNALIQAAERAALAAVHITPLAPDVVAHTWHWM